VTATQYTHEIEALKQELIALADQAHLPREVPVQNTIFQEANGTLRDDYASWAEKAEAFRSIANRIQLNRKAALQTPWEELMSNSTRGIIAPDFQDHIRQLVKGGNEDVQMDEETIHRRTIHRRKNTDKEHKEGRREKKNTEGEAENNQKNTPKRTNHHHRENGDTTQHHNPHQHPPQAAQ
jgi:hypothetical protein